MKKSAKRLTALLLALAMCLSLLSSNVWASELGEPPLEDSSASVQSDENAAAEASVDSAPSGEDSSASTTGKEETSTEESASGKKEAAPEAEAEAPQEEPAESEKPSEPEKKEVKTQAVVDSGTCGNNLTWTLDDAGTLTISGSGEMNDFSRGVDPKSGLQPAPWYDNRKEIQSVALTAA